MKKITIDFAKSKGSVPVIIQEFSTNEVLMLGYMNELACQQTLSSGWVYFWSRSRQQLWFKGKTSGNKLQVKTIMTDCDTDTLLIKVKLVGKAVCHTGTKSCFTSSINVRNP